MSIRVMSQVWDNGPEKQGHLLVMLALADYADDAGKCWPSIASIAAKARMSERGVQKIIRALEVDGWLKIDTGNGRHGCNQYTINPERHSGFQASKNPEPRSPRTTFTPNDDAETPNESAKNPEPRSPEPSLTIIDPSENINARAKPKRKTQIPEDAVLSEKMESIARNEGISQQEAETQFDRFKGYCIANAKTYASWDAAWRNWLRSPFFKPITTGGPNGKPSRTNSTADAISLAARMRRSPGANRG